MSNMLAALLICHYLSGLSTIRLKQPFEKSLSRDSIASGLKKYINHFTILVHSPL